MILKRQKLPYEDVYRLLKRFSSSFIPTLEEEGNIAEYAQKLSQRAFFELYIDQEIMGYIAYYINEDMQLCFITSVAVDKKCQGLGIATQLLSELIESLPICIDTIKLEVAKCAIPALKLYSKAGFTIDSENDIKYTMINNLIK